MYRIAYELSLAESLRFERRLFHGLFATNDQKEGLYSSHSYFHSVSLPLCFSHASHLVRFSPS